jgi:hypothetical protein
MVDWSLLPDHLRAMIPWAEKYGSLQFDDPINEYLASIPIEEIPDLKEAGRFISENWDAIRKLLDDNPMTDSVSSRRIYFLMHFLGLANDRGLLD